MNQQYQGTVESAVEEAAGAFCPQRPLIDIRTKEERQTGMPTGAISISAEDLAARCRKNGGEIEGAYVICAEGVRSRAAVLKLKEQGVDGFSSVTGGFKAWLNAGLPVSYPAGLDANLVDRYARHLVMPQVGAQGQRKLLESRILLVGLGGLNSPVALYLAAAGVGTLGLVDFDSVERTRADNVAGRSEEAVKVALDLESLNVTENMLSVSNLCCFLVGRSAGGTIWFQDANISFIPNSGGIGGSC